ncbi:LysR substrate-binding domain-containing protein [Paraburkholderia sediminicola]|uniref:LysR substrate-binding domain-containing protein n=1 Tax=Paraburkholderia sediminicola TaxID=458836 RepID=UPI0038BBCC2F
MRRKIPSTTALAMFESAANHQSFTKAADELSVTQSAVCRQIAALEDFLGVRLFRRTQRGVYLTEAGLTYSRQVRQRLDEVERDTLNLMAKGGARGALELAVVPTFATKWLMPRLPLFAALHPGITINLSAQTRPFLFSESAFNAAIHPGRSPWPGTSRHFLMNEDLVAVCSPRLIAPGADIPEEDWRKYTLLQQSTRPYAWRQWFALQGLQVEGDMTGPRLELFSMHAEAAIQGMGIALIPRLLIEKELAEGQLTVIGGRTHPSDRPYFLILPDERSEDAALVAFRTWLVARAIHYVDSGSAVLLDQPAGEL